ncbi:MAG: tetratricopeptide repeat protein [Solirubrobacteraceae bacterium]
MRSNRRENPEYYSRWRDVLNALRYALVAFVVAVGFAAVGIAGRIWAFIPALIAAVFAVVDAILAWRGFQAAEAKELQDLLAGKACRAGQARASEYGVDVAVLPEGQEWRYVCRDCEPALRAALRAALAGEGSPLVMLSGETKSGKTRAAFEALRWDELKDAWLVTPRNGASIEALLRPGTLPRTWTPLVVWLDDIERYTSGDANGLHEGVLRNLDCDRPVVMLATEGGRAIKNQTELLADPVEQLRSLAVCIDVNVALSNSELARAEQVYGEDLVAEIEQLGIGRRMVAMNELKHRLTRSRDRPREGVAVVRAAIDWRRAGVLRPLSARQLDLLYRHHLSDDLDPSDELFETGLRWARTPLPRTSISLLRKTSGEVGGYEPYDLAVELASAEWPAVDEPVLREITSLAEPHDCLQMATVAYDAGDSALALELLDRAESSDDRSLSSIAAFNVGILLADRGDMRGAEAAYRRADQLGSQRGAFNLGQILRHRGSLDDAEAAYRRADERGSPEGAVNLGVLLEQRGDLSGAQAAYRRSRERGSSKGANNLDRLLADRGGPSDIEAAQSGAS